MSLLMKKITYLRKFLIYDVLYLVSYQEEKNLGVKIKAKPEFLYKSNKDR
jgi:hypothetical protein